MLAGVFRAIVQDTRDPAERGRIRVTIPSLSGPSRTDWVWPLVNCGYLVTPTVGEQVWVTFEAGDEDNPVWVGSTKTHLDYYDLIQRVDTLETQVATLQSAVASLQSTAHTH